MQTTLNGKDADLALFGFVSVVFDFYLNFLNLLINAESGTMKPLLSISYLIGSIWTVTIVQGRE